MKFDHHWETKINDHQIDFRILDIDDNGELLRRTNTLIGRAQYYGGHRHLHLVGVSLPDVTYDYDPYAVPSNFYTSIRKPKYYRPIISGDVITYDGLSLLFKMRDNVMGYGLVNLSNVFSHETVPKMVEILQIVKTIDFTRTYTHDEVLREIERYMML